MHVLNYNPVLYPFSAPLSEQQKDQVSRYGFIHLKGFLEAETVENLLEEVRRIELMWLARQLTHINGIPLKIGYDQGHLMLQRMCFINQHSSLLQAFLADERFKALVPLLNEADARLAQDEKDGLVFNHYIRHEGSRFSQMGWHTDSPRDLFLGGRIRPMLNVGIHLDDCPKQHGGLRVLPGTHKQGFWKTVLGKRQFLDHRPHPGEVGFDIQAGDLTVHHGSLWHRVAASPFSGEVSRRRVLYIPIVCGPYQPKNETSPTPFYHRLARFVQN